MYEYCPNLAYYRHRHRESRGVRNNVVTLYNYNTITVWPGRDCLLITSLQPSITACDDQWQADTATVIHITQAGAAATSSRVKIETRRLLTLARHHQILDPCPHIHWFLEHLDLVFTRQIEYWKINSKKGELICISRNRGWIKRNRNETLFLLNIVELLTPLRHMWTINRGMMTHWSS